MLEHGSDSVQIEIRGNHHQWVLNVRDERGSRRTYTFQDYGELIGAVLEELALIWAREGRPSSRN